ncbi:MAG: hypothetical protein AAF184_17290 [Pseudomonadota bacterium]
MSEETWVTLPGGEVDFASWAVRSLFRATRDQLQPSAWQAETVQTSDQARLEQQLVDCQWELALQHELLDGNPMLCESLIRRGASPSRDMEPVVAYVRSQAGRAFVREQFLGCLAILARDAADTLAQVPPEPDVDGVLPTLAERVAEALNARLARHGDALRRILGLAHTDTGALIGDGTVYQLLERCEGSTAA